MFGATSSLATTSAEDLHLFRVEMVRPLPEMGHLFLTRILSLDRIGYIVLETNQAVIYHARGEADTKTSLDLDSRPKYWPCTGSNT